MLPKFTYVRPSSLDDAVAILGEGAAAVHGGGTDLLGCLRDGILAPKAVVSLAAIDDLRGIQPAGDGGLRIGAMTTIADIAADSIVRDRYRGLWEAAQVVASPQLRTQGTIAGNLCQRPRCWYYRGEFHCLRKGGDTCFAHEGENRYHCIFGGDMCFIVHPSDTAPVLAAFNAVCRVTGSASSRSIPVETLHVPPAEDPQRETVLETDEIVTHVVVPPPLPGARSSYRKVRARAAWDFALAGVAMVLLFEGPTVAAARVFLSGAAPIPWRATGVETAIIGSSLDGDTIARAAAAAVDGAEPLAKNGYKVPMFEGLITEELERHRRSV